MGLLETLNTKSGYSEERMVQTFRELFPKGDVQLRCPIAVSFKRKVSLLRSKVVASGFAALPDGRSLALYMPLPVKRSSLYSLNAPEKLQIKNAAAGQKVLEARLLNLVSKEYDDLTLQIAPNVPGFPHQAENLKRFLETIGAGE